MRYAPRYTGTLCRRLGSGLGSTLGASTGGQLAWAYGMDNLGIPHWQNLTDVVGDWSQSSSKTAPAWENGWHRPEAERARLSFEERFIDAILGRGTGMAAPASQGLCNRALCERPLEFNVSATDYPLLC